MRVLLVIAPFGGLDRPSLGVHTLQSVARQSGHCVDVLYSNLIFASLFGKLAYLHVNDSPTSDLLGERIMGLPAGALIPDEMLATFNRKISEKTDRAGDVCKPVSRVFIWRAIETWLEAVAKAVQPATYDVIGLSTTFEQTNGVARLAELFRPLAPNAKLVPGGANCEGPLAAAVKQLIPELDSVFSGESEFTFTRYLDDFSASSGASVITSQPTTNLDDIPPLNYDEFFRQLDQYLPNSRVRSLDLCEIPFESSRGCWWGQKHHCTFCGLNGGGMKFREKNSERVCAELEVLASQTGLRRISMADNIMPHTYFTSLVPELGRRKLGLTIFYEQKANLSFDCIEALKHAGIERIQPGIEALNDDLLALMKKGTTCRLNVALLRYAKIVGMDVGWNLLSGFPGEHEGWYEETLGLAHLITHLQPPVGVSTLSFDRFSPYFDDAARYGLSNLRPHPSYHEAFPACADVAGLAYHFVADSDGLKLSTNPVLNALRTQIMTWRAAWYEPESADVPPCLEVIEISADKYALIDSRPSLGTDFMQELSVHQAAAALCFQPRVTREVAGAEARLLCVSRGDGFVPLAGAAPSGRRRFESLAPSSTKPCEADPVLNTVFA